MPRELGERERDERPDDQTDELEKLRDHIKERYEESDGEKDEDLSRGLEDNDKGDESSEQDPDHSEKTTESTGDDVVPSSQTPEELQEQTGADAVGKLESGSEDHRDEELEQLRERINERYEEATDEDQQEGARSPGANDERDSPEPGLTHDERPSESPSVDDGQQSAEAHQERPETGGETREDEETLLESRGENGSDDRLGHSGELVGAEPRTDAREDDINRDAEESGNDTVPGATSDREGEDREESESPLRRDSDSLDAAWKDEDETVAVLQEATWGRPPGSEDQREQNFVETSPSPQNDEEEVSVETQERVAASDFETGQTTSKEGGTGESLQSGSRLGPDDLGGEKESSLETHDDAVSPSGGATEGFHDQQAVSDKPDGETKEGTEVLGEREGLVDVPKDGEDGKALHPVSPQGHDDLGGDSVIGTEIRGELMGHGLELRGEENVVSRGDAIRVREEPQQVWEAPEESVNRNSVQATNLVGDGQTPKLGDGGAYRLEAAKESRDGVDSRPITEDSKGQRNPQEDRAPPEVAEPKPVIGKEAGSGVVQAVTPHAESKATKEQPSEGQGVLDRSNGKTNRVNLPTEAAARLSKSAELTSNADSGDGERLGETPRNGDDRPAVMVGAKSLYRKEIVDLDKLIETALDSGSARPSENNIQSKQEAGDHLVSSGPRQESAAEEITLQVRATRTGGENSYAVFNLMKVHLEEQAGMKLEGDKLYHLNGSIEGVYDFDIYRTITNYARIMVPSEHRDRVEFGNVYNITIRSIREVPLTEAQREILVRSRGLQYRALLYRLGHAKVEPVDSPGQALGGLKPGERRSESARLEKLDRKENVRATFNPIFRLQSGRDPRVYFRIDNSSFQKKTGTEIEEGGSYKVNVRIEGVGPFQKTLRSLAARQDIPFYVPAELRDKVEAGRRYQVTVEEIERLPKRKESWQTGELLDAGDWTWRDIGAWIDTEGTVFSAARYLAIAQKEKRVMQQICAFLDEHQLDPKLRLDRNTGVYYVHVYGWEKIARIIKEVEPFIRTENKKSQIELFKEHLMQPRQKLQSSVIRARKILGLPENSGDETAT